MGHFDPTENHFVMQHVDRMCAEDVMQHKGQQWQLLVKFSGTDHLVAGHAVQHDEGQKTEGDPGNEDFHVYMENCGQIAVMFGCA